MRPATLIPTLLLTTLAATGCGLFQPATDDLKVRDLDWLAGTWRAVIDGQLVEQRWEPPANGMMSGTHRTLEGDRLLLAADFQILGGLNGIVLYGSVDSRPRRLYSLVESGRGFLRFENPRPAFPREGVFDRRGDTLYVTLRGLDELQGPREVAFELELQD